MTYFEKLMEEHPELTDPELDAIVSGSCPEHYGYEPERSSCPEGQHMLWCGLCWDREMEESK